MDGFGFWAAAGLMAFVVGAMMLRALAAQTSTGQDDSGTAKQMSLYRDQLAEVDRDMARGVIEAGEAARLRTEVQRRILETARSAPQASEINAKRGRGGMVLASAAIFAALTGGAALYLGYGAPGYGDLPLTKRLALAETAYASRPSQEQAEAAAPQAPQPDADPQFVALIEQLRAAVAARPDDIAGQALLARNEALLGNYAASARAYQAMIAAKGADASADDYLGAAQAMISAAAGFVSPQAEAMLREVLARDPSNGLARYFSGLMFAQTGRPDRTFALWEPLLAESPQGAPWLEPIRALLPEVASAAGVQYRLAPQTGPSADEMAAAADMTPQERSNMISAMVAGLETRLITEGTAGTGVEWARLISSLGVMGETDRARAALRAAQSAMAADPAAMQAISEAATSAGIAP